MSCLCLEVLRYSPEVAKGIVDEIQVPDKQLDLNSEVLHTNRTSGEPRAAPCGTAEAWCRGASISGGGADEAALPVGRCFPNKRPSSCSWAGTGLVGQCSSLML